MSYKCILQSLVLIIFNLLGSTNSTTVPMQPIRPNLDKNKPKPIIANIPKVINSSTNQVKRSKKSNSSDDDE